MMTDAIDRERARDQQIQGWFDTAVAEALALPEAKRRTKNHLADQLESFRMGDKDSKREDDLLDTFCYSIALSLGDDKGLTARGSVAEVTS
jgi:hypothetical protein